MTPDQTDIDGFCFKHVDRIENLNLILDQIRDDSDPATIECFLLYLWTAITKRWPHRMTMRIADLGTPGTPEPPQTVN